MAAVPFALVGGFWYVWALGHNLSVASAVGFIALAGVAAEFGVVMLIYLKQALERRLAAGAPADDATLLEAIEEGAVLRVRPKAMTVAVILAGLAPIMWSARHGQRGDAAHRRADDRRDDHGTAALDGRDSGRVLLDAASRDSAARRAGAYAARVVGDLALARRTLRKE